MTYKARLSPALFRQRTNPAAYSPWAALSAVAAPASSQALCGAASAAVAGVAAQSASGCVFPTVDAPVPAPVAALGGLAALLLSNGDNGPDQISVSP